MKKFLLAFLFIPFFAFSQSNTAVICEENFSTAGNYKCVPSAQANPPIYSNNQNGSLCFTQTTNTQLNTTDNIALLGHGDLSYPVTADLLQYDSIILDIDLDISSEYYFQYMDPDRVTFQCQIPQQFQYTDPSTSESFLETAIFKSNFELFCAPNPTYKSNPVHIQAKYSTVNIVNASGIVIFSYVRTIDFSKPIFLGSSQCIASNGAQVIDCFCNKTTNPPDCKAKLSTMQIFSPPFTFCNDNFKITGLKNGVLTALETNGAVKEKTIIAAFDPLGKKIENVSAYQGVLIRHFSDGSHSKEYHVAE